MLSIRRMVGKLKLLFFGMPLELQLNDAAGCDWLEKFDIETAAAAELAVAAIESRDLTIASVEAKPANRNPSAPFMTSSLQQEASRKFGFGARQVL